MRSYWLNDKLTVTGARIRHRMLRAWTAAFISQFVSQFISFTTTCTNKCDKPPSSVTNQIGYSAWPRAAHRQNLCACCRQQWAQAFYHFNTIFCTFSWTEIIQQHLFLTANKIDNIYPSHYQGWMSGKSRWVYQGWDLIAISGSQAFS
jgi:hypothetical protein